MPSFRANLRKFAAQTVTYNGSLLDGIMKIESIFIGDVAQRTAERLGWRAFQIPNISSTWRVEGPDLSAQLTLYRDSRGYLISVQIGTKEVDVAAFNARDTAQKIATLLGGLR